VFGVDGGSKAFYRKGMRASWTKVSEENRTREQTGKGQRTKPNRDRESAKAKRKEKRKIQPNET